MSIPIRVLILEDRIADAELMLHELRRAGFEPDWQRVDDEPGYLAALETNPDLILADWSLPQFSGLRALQLLRERGLDFPFIIMSGSIGEEAAVEAIRQGAADYLLKDRPARLGLAVEHALHEKRLRDEKRQAEQTLYESEQKFRSFVEQSEDATVLTDEQGIVIEWNQAAERVFGLPQSDVLGHPLWEIQFRGVLPERKTAAVYEQLKSAMLDALKTGQAPWLNRLTETVFQRPDGTQPTIQTMAFAIPSQGGFRLGCISRDITDRKRMEQALFLMSDTQKQIAHLDSVTDIYHLVGQKIQELVGDGYVVISILDEQAQVMNVLGIYGFGGLYEKLVRTFKLDPTRMTYPLKDMTDDELSQFRSGRLERFEGGLYNLLVRKVPKRICRAVERQLGFTGIYTMSFIWQGVHFGGITLLAKHDVASYRDMIETLMNQAAIAIMRIRSEEQLRQSEAALKKAQQVSHVGSWIWHIPTNRVEWSDEMYRIFGIEKESFSGDLSKVIRDTIHPDDRAAVEQSNLLVTRDRKPTPLEYRVIRSDGTVRTLWGEAGELALDEAGNPLILTGIVQDITERKQSQEALHKSEALFHSLVESLPQNVFSKDLQGRFTFANRRYCAGEGKSLGDILGKTDFDLHPPELAVKYQGDDRRVIETGEILDVVEEHQPLGGNKTYVQVIKAPLYDGKGHVAGVLGIFWDITERKRAEEALHESEERFRRLFELSPDAIVLIDPHATEVSWPIVSCNESACRMNGYQRSELIGQSIDLLHERAASPAERDTYLEQIRREGSFKGQAIHRRKDGTLFPTMFSTALIVLGDRELILGIDRDITEIKNVEETLKQRAAQLLLLNDVSRRVARVMNLDELFDTTASLIHESFSYEHVGIFIADKQQDSDLIMKARAGLYASRFPSDHRIKLGEGMVGWVALYGKRLLANDVTKEVRFYDPFGDGSIKAELSVPICSEMENVGVIDVQSRLGDSFSENDIMVIETLADVLAVALHNAQLYQELEAYSSVLAKAVQERTEELSRTKDHIEAILNSVGEAIIVFGTDGRIHQVNPAFERLTGYWAADVEMHPYDDPQIIMNLSDDIFLQALHGGDWHGEVQAWRRDGSTFDAAVSISQILDKQGDVVALVGAMRDISPLKEVERLKDAFVSNVSHELRTPITSLKLLHHLLEVNPTKQASYLEQLGRVIGRLNVLIEDLLRLSRLDQGRVEMNIVSVDLKALVHQHIADFALLAESKQLTLAIEDSGGQSIARADQGLLGQVLSVLLTNALNYTPAGGRVVLQVLTAEEEGRAWAGFSVSDTGAGIPQEEQDQLFQRFFRGNVGRASGAPGTGLGLAIAREIVERHGGRIGVTSKGTPGEGATFTTWLPAGDKTTVKLEEIQHG